ncbi:MAG TPA: anaerobic ribonucleoside-triphosphate reductase [bacterium]|nr:anaerobic ribonucleoside-triphosphate reductase [bacterium]HOL35134.1 anaerobic ribonucleoside-triphosphate reductase [bacterium]HPP08563.1 anaerobic ribonucleoside-triphosphate reductase [bacterium]
MSQGINTDKIEFIQKRDGRIVPFEKAKIAEAIFKAAQSVGGQDRYLAEDLAEAVTVYLNKEFKGKIPTVEEIQDIVEKVLIKTGHAKTAKAYILYREKRARIRQIKQGIIQKDVLEEQQEIARIKESTDLSLFVRTSGEDIVLWDIEKIVDSLVKETGIERKVATFIATEVEKEIIASKVKNLTAPLIREMVNAKLVEFGMEEARRKYTRLGLPLYDVKNIIFSPNKENANIPHNPEATNLTLAEQIKKEFALLEVFSPEISDAHLSGDLHLHDLGFIDRPYCSGQSLEYVKKFGLHLPNALSIAKPAKHPETLLAHMVKFSAALQGHFNGAIGWDAVNIFFAPFLEGASDTEMKQLAQMLIYEYSQQAVARGGQAIFSDINLYWEIPDHFIDVPAIGPGGKETGKKYVEYQQTAQRFAKALFEVYLEGDGIGRPFFFPKPLLHITNRFFQTPGHEQFLELVCIVAAEKGNPYFVFDRDNTARISECCRLSFKLEASDIEDAKTPWKMRFSALQNVTLNLPRVAYNSNHDDSKLFQNLENLMNLAVKAHIEKRYFIETLLSYGQNGPLALLTMNLDGEPYLRMHRVTHLIGLLGLNEMIQYHTGSQLHESDDAFKFGLKVVAFLKILCDRKAKETGLRFVLEQTPAESTAYRLARLDYEHFPLQSTQVLKGTLPDKVYYTNSTYLNISEPLSPIERVKKEGIFHPLIEAGALTHIWLGESKPDSKALSNFVVKVFQNTKNAQIAFSPEFTSCLDCGRVYRGISKECPWCSKLNNGVIKINAKNQLNIF